MFFEQIVLAKNRALGKIWLAAHWEKKLTKGQIADINIIESVDNIQKPQAPMALRLSGHLLLGVVRIYHKKVEFMYTECNEAFVKIKMAFRPGLVDMEESTANLNAITMPENFEDIDVILPSDVNTEYIARAEEGLFSLQYVARVDEITEIEEMRNKDISQSGPIEFFSQGDTTVGNEYDLLKPVAGSEFEPSIPFEGPPTDDSHQIVDNAAGTFIEPPPLDPMVDIVPPDFVQEPSQPLPPPEQEKVPFEAIESSSTSEKELAISEMADLAPAARRLRNKRFKVDKRTQLSKNVMAKTIENVKPLLRTLERAPPTREAMRLRQLEIDGKGYSYLLSDTADTAMAPKLKTLITRTMRTREQIELPKKSLEDSSVEEQRKQHVEEQDHPALPEPMQLTDLIGTQFNEPEQEPLNIPPQEYTAPSMDMPEPTIDTLGTIEPLPSTTGEETDKSEAFVITKRTAAMHQFLDKKFSEGQADLTFQQLFVGKKRRTVTVAFFELLNIRTKNCINLEQAEHYQDIKITKTPFFDRLTI
uniref:Rad21/Rec8-like protein N-terminal domain-containing protein n=1 Tax=Arcella intermedia TaxID=1963864 RepID=A0A6B2L1K0_9EUKA|eukprot:TRINITY_DN11762_c0_g1_i1.p1 TRINITY_DN11762_c0_g1~~TRINITY_DN11762_c0_g1_i1.p1  ORF type:complete len:532 (-),score=141.21 TRINITY_DN11762_c0_g1_i1:90-1685(-)